MGVVSVVAEATDFSAALALVRSLDAQTVPAEDLELVLRVDRPDVALAGQLRGVAAYRPFLRVEVGDAPAAGLATGTWVLVLAPGETLYPSAVQRLREFAEAHGLDAVAGRAVLVAEGGSAGPDDLVPPVIWADRDEVPAGDVPLLVGGRYGPVLVRRDSGAAAVDGSALTRSSRVGVLGVRPSARRPVSVGPAAVASMASAVARPRAFAVERVEWDDGVLRLTARGAVEGAEPELRAVLRIQHDRTGEILLLPAEATTRGLTVEVRVGLDPRRVDGSGEGLAAGVWRVGLGLASPAGLVLPSVDLSWTPCPPALIGDIVVVPTGSAGSVFALDVGPTTVPLVAGVEPSAGTVHESARGSELVLPLPDLQVHDTDGMVGFVALDSLRLPARIRVGDGPAELVALVSGVPGRVVLGTQFGPGPVRPTGLSLQIAITGEMSLIRTPAPVKPAAKQPARPARASGGTRAGKPAAGKSGAGKSGTGKAAAGKPARQAAAKRRRQRRRRGPLADLRRAVPAPLEPVVRRLARVPLARRLYRRFTSR